MTQVACGCGVYFPGLPQSENVLSLNNNPVSVIELAAKSRELEAMLQTKFCYSLKEINSI